MIEISVQTESFDPGAILERVGGSGGGAVASFVGIVRSDGEVVSMELEQYEGMTDQALRELAVKARDKWDLLGVYIVHRYGLLKTGEKIVVVATSAKHRRAALESCAWLIDRIKIAAPFWKKEYLADGTTKWVEESRADAARAKKLARRR